MHGKNKPEVLTSKKFFQFGNRAESCKRIQFEDIYINNLPIVEDILQLAFWSTTNLMTKSEVQLAEEMCKDTKILHILWATIIIFVLIGELMLFIQQFRAATVTPFTASATCCKESEQPATGYSDEEKHRTIKGSFCSRSWFFFLEKITRSRRCYSKTVLYFILGPFVCTEGASKAPTQNKWIAKHFSNPVSIPSNLAKQPIFLCNADPLQHWDGFKN